jgi:DNA-binding transcriptional LysR family regulator
MLSLHQLRCFLTVYEQGSLTAAAEELGYAQPSISEQVRALEKSIGLPLFRRVGRGVVPTTVADTLRPHAEATLAAAEEALRAVQRVKAFETGTIRFGMFGSARLYVSAGLVTDVLERYPGVRVEIIGLNSAEVLEDLRRGRIEAALIAAPPTSEGLTVVPVARDEMVYVSLDPARTASPVTARRLAEAQLVLADTSYRATDSMRTALRKMLHESGHNPQTRIEVEDVETAIELVGRGLADTVVHQGAARELVPRLAPGATWTSLRPRQWETFAIVHRVNATLSPAAGLMIELAVDRIRKVAEPIGRD